MTSRTIGTLLLTGMLCRVATGPLLAEAPLDGDEVVVSEIESGGKIAARIVR